MRAKIGAPKKRHNHSIIFLLFHKAQNEEVSIVSFKDLYIVMPSIITEIALIYFWVQIPVEYKSLKTEMITRENDFEMRVA